MTDKDDSATQNVGQGWTPGPWRDEGTDNEDWSVDYDGGDCMWCFVGPEGRTPVTICVAKGYRAEQRLDANARLIAAAPEMLEALREIEARSASKLAQQIARAAIAKAEGKA